MGDGEIICSKCKVLVAVKVCNECELKYCEDCCSRRHSKGSFSRHLIFSLTKCDECQSKSSVMRCSECELDYCSACCREVHCEGTMKNHADYVDYCLNSKLSILLRVDTRSDSKSASASISSSTPPSMSPPLSDNLSSLVLGEDLSLALGEIVSQNQSSNFFGGGAFFVLRTG